jgi:carbonic anhydrase
MKDAWSRGQDIQVHGWIYGIQDGLLRNLGDPITATSEI